MPKVSDKYYEEKKNIIMDAALELTREIPLYQITMSDIIRKLKCSQGMIYKYYKSVDEIYIDLMNRETRDIEFVNQIDSILESTESEEYKLESLFQALGGYILAVQEKIGGKFLYEIQVRYAFDEKKQTELLPHLIYKKNMMYFQMATINHLVQGIETGVFGVRRTLENIANYVGTAIDGIINYSALQGDICEEKVRNDVLTMFEMLSTHMLCDIIINKER